MYIILGLYWKVKEKNYFQNYYYNDEKFRTSKELVRM